jgi:amino acid adenylation domain-containing protein
VLPAGAAAPANLAFLLYTSGSTGTPKAVGITHENVIDYVDWCSHAFTPSERDKFAAHAPLHFSLSVFHLYVAWKHGATVVLIDEQTARVPQLLAPVIEHRGITIWKSAPKILSLLAQSGQLPSVTLAPLRLVMFGGEPMPIPDLRSLKAQLPHPRYVHILGSTETHIIAHHELAPEAPAATDVTVPVGPVAGRFRSRIVDENANDVCAGAAGELCLAGRGVTPGYWRSADGAARFFTDADGERWYRTGDIVAAASDGALVYRGRIDRMIKRRGHRVELGEIEACLCGNAGVKEAAVVAAPHDALGVKVKAFVVRYGRAHPTGLELKAYCARSLPAYMVPDAIAFRDALPRTSTGKIDMPALKQLL